MSRSAHGALLIPEPAPCFASVAVAVPLRTTFTYRVPPDLRPQVSRGHRVLVPYRSGTQTAIVLSLADTAPAHLSPDKIRSIVDALDDEPLFPEPQLALCGWLANYYHVPIGEAVHAAVPSGGLYASGAQIAWTEADTGALSPIAQALAVILKARGRPAPAQETLRHVAGARHRHLLELEAAGALRIVAEQARERTRPKTTQRLHLRAWPDDGRIGIQQARVLKFLKDHGDATSDELRDLYGTTAATIRSLVSRGAIDAVTEELYRDPFSGVEIETRTHDPVLTQEQSHALDALRRALREPFTRVALVHGVTGSGKTEVYLHLIRDARALGKRALILLPEIALTPQFVGIFRAALGDAVAVLHSGLSPGQRYDQWRRIRRGEVDVVIGARSAIFAPITALGVIVVDEEHDTSFKQEGGIPYNARDLAVVLGKYTGALVVLGSATPSLESVYNAERGRYARIQLNERVNARAMPEVDLVDMRLYPADPEAPVTRYLSTPLQAAVRDAVRAGEQAIIFLNRRGFAPTYGCVDCGSTLQCASCDITLTYHQRGHVVRCHYCGFSAPVPDTCPTCSSSQLISDGAGTEQIETLIAEAFSDVRVARLDADTARGNALLRILDAFRAGETDVLIGTQMVTKGHDFPNVTLVGVINADQSLRFPDFRSGERTFQLLTQVSGRAGRHEKPGRVLIQTHNPEHYVLGSACTANFNGYAKRELKFRERTGYPPYGHMVACRFDGLDYGEVHRAAEALARELRGTLSAATQVLGPVDAPIARLRNRYRVHITIRGRVREELHRGARAATRYADTLASGRRVRLAVDVDPINLL